MPTYEYRCPKCGHEYEKLQKITDNSRAKCPTCGTRGERVISAGAGFIFKGSGFYITDYKKKSVEEKAEKPETAAKPDKADKTGKTDKPANNSKSKSPKAGADS
ncbi:MAG: zinc ribbon domain-containing protein [Gemmatimonadetes bacterium]|nr:zinc ribbon domain-containing protein [Gemmatimonadota bacterium]